MKVPRFLNEIFNPSLKCERLGHKTELKKVIIRRQNYTSLSVAIDYLATVDKCVRCGHCSCPRDEQFYDSYTSVSMPNSMWRELKREGYIILKP